jgi:type VI secretion system protein
MKLGKCTVVGSLLALAGCGLVTRTQRMFGGSLPLEVSIVATANRTSAIAVDLLVVYDSQVLDRLLQLAARDWFRDREQWRRDYPAAFELWGWEWVPGQPVARQVAEYRAGAKAALVFADYLTPGAHRVEFDPHSPARLILGETTLEVEPLKE